MRSNSPKRIHIFGRAKLNSQTLVVICILFELRFAHLKIHHGFERMRLRGLSGARDEFHLAAIVQNLKTLALRAIKAPNAVRPASFA
jgi:hypothetical protein